MGDINYAKLQNGSDIRGIAMDNEWKDPVNLTDEAVRHLAAAFVVWLREKTEKEELRIALGRDSRITGEKLLQNAAEGISKEDGTPFDFGIASTPAMFMSTILPPYEFDGSIMITASHLPYHRNGMKFFTPKGGLEKEDIKKITMIASELSFTGPYDSFAEKLDFMDIYADYLCQKIREGAAADDRDHPLSGLHIIVDAGNGAGGFFESKVLKALGADTSGSQFLEPDGRFPNHVPNPEDKTAAAAIREATLREKADLGIIFDTDVDRAGAVLPDGRTLTRNVLIALLSRIALAEHPGTTIVTDSITSDGLKDFILAHGGKHRRFKRGYRNVINESIRLNEEGTDSQLAIETSGHGAWKENYFLDDGAYLMVKLLIEMGKGHQLSEMIADLKEPAESAEVRFPVTRDNVAETADAVLSLITEEGPKHKGWTLEQENYEGVRINCGSDAGNGWFLMRKSLHEPIMPLNLESEAEGGVQVMAKGLLDLLRKAEGLDLAPLEALVKQ
ncbi:MAG: phosphomannomutase/phosphoglucomutase [Lachnospiraceae bacterium]|nr:phosphomannomutase/phosphoglucomutase [Lachnospiraceae bacterium]